MAARSGLVPIAAWVDRTQVDVGPGPSVAAAESPQPMECDSPAQPAGATASQAAPPALPVPTQPASPGPATEDEAAAAPQLPGTAALAPARPALAEGVPKFRMGRSPRGPTADIQRHMALVKEAVPAHTGDPFWRALEGALSNCAEPSRDAANKSVSNFGRSGSSAIGSPPEKELQTALDRVFTKDAVAAVLPAMPSHITAGAPHHEITGQNLAQSCCCNEKVWWDSMLLLLLLPRRMLANPVIHEPASAQKTGLLQSPRHEHKVEALSM